MTIACTYEIAHLYLMPRHEALQEALRRTMGDAAQIRVMTVDYEALEDALDPRIDLLFAYRAEPYGAEAGAPGTQAVAAEEAIAPICAPSFAARHEAVLAQAPTAWRALPFLQLAKPNLGWATWEDWLSRADAAQLKPRYLRFDNYVYLLEAAAAGRGLALGWRGLIERYIEMDALTVVGDGRFERFDRALYLRLTRRGRERAAARVCFAHLTEASDGERSEH